MAKRKNSVAFFEAGSWYHRLKILKDDGTTLYSKKGGFATAEAAEASYRKYEQDYARAYRNFHSASSADFDLKDYLIYWLEEIYSSHIENTTRMLAAYTLYDLIIPNLNQSIKLKFVNVEFLDALLEKASKSCKSAGNKCREFLNLAMKEALVQGYISSNPVPLTKPYKRKKPNIIVLNKQEMQAFLKKASENNWYLEILLV